MIVEQALMHRAGDFETFTLMAEREDAKASTARLHILDTSTHAKPVH